MTSASPGREPLEQSGVGDPPVWLAPTGGRAASAPRWWLELVYVVVFYVLYSAVRNLQGSASVSTHRAFEDARMVIGLEERLHVFVEHGAQRLALHFVPAIDVANMFTAPRTSS